MRQNGTSFSVGIAQSSLFSCVIFNQNASPRVVSEKIIDAHFLCAEDHLPYQGRQYSMKEFADLQSRLPRKIGQYNCKHMAVPILLGAPPAYSEETLEEMRRNSAEKIEIDGRTMSRYEWTQEQRRIETAVRYQKDRGVLATHAGNMEIRRDAQGKINALMGRYEKISEKAGLHERRSRTYVEGFEHVKLKKKLEGAAMGRRKANTGSWPVSGKKISVDELSALKTYASDRHVDLRSFENFDGDVSLIRDFIDGIAEVARDFPETAKKERLLQLRCSFQIDPDTYAVTTKRCISINANAYRNCEALSKDYSREVEEGMFAAGTNYRSIAYHEMGHVVIDTYGLSAKKMASGITSSEISKYAMKSSDETVAESFSVYYAGIDNEAALTIFSNCSNMAMGRRR